jgi:thiosulfate/3-mercaptopyruvate sulfurtransferase
MMPSMPATFARPELLASPDWLAESLARPGVRILDCRWRTDGSARRLFAEGHIPGAVFLDWAAGLVDRADPLPFQLAGPEQVADTLSAVGLDSGMTAVLYDDTNSLYACRVWWSLQVYGFDAVRVLDGGWAAWSASGRPASTGTPRFEPTTFQPRADPRRRLATSDVRALLGSPEIAIVDARTPTEFRGHDGSSERRGHIPGAVNVPAALLSRPGEQVFRPPAQLTRLFADARVPRQRRVIVYDATGIGAAKVAFVLTLLGYPDVAVYDGGWGAWSGRGDLPVER